MNDKQKMDALEASSIRRTKDYLCHNKYLKTRPINKTSKEPLEVFEVTDKGKAYIKSIQGKF